MTLSGHVQPRTLLVEVYHHTNYHEDGYVTLRAKGGGLITVEENPMCCATTKKNKPCGNQAHDGGQWADRDTVFDPDNNPIHDHILRRVCRVHA